MINKLPIYSSPFAFLLLTCNLILLHEERETTFVFT